jgi:hypothetical protein
MKEGLGEIAMEIPGTVMAAVPVAAEFVADAALSVSAKLPAGGMLGGVWVVGAPLAVMVGETLPQGATEQDTLQVTPPLLGSPETAAENCAAASNCTMAMAGVTETVIPGTVIVTEVVAAESVTDVAVSITVSFPSVGTVGAV